MSKKNPYIEPENYFSGYNDSVDKLKEQPEIVQFARLCYEVFEMNASGRKILQILEDRILKGRLVNISNPNYQVSCIHAEGMRDVVRELRESVISHQQRIKSEVNNNVGK